MTHRRFYWVRKPFSQIREHLFSLVLMTFMQASLLDAYYFKGFVETLPSTLRKIVPSVNIRHIDLLGGTCVLQISGLLNTSLSWDTRQILGFRENTIPIFPLPHLYDKFHQDINSHGQWRIGVDTSILGLIFWGPKYDNVKLDALIAVDFLGSREFSMSSMRFFYGFARIKWPHDALLFGQLWHPLLVPNCYPQTVSYSLGTPFEPRARCPQLRYVHSLSNVGVDIIAVASSQVGFVSPGPMGPSSEYIRNAVIPNFTLVFRKYFGNHQAGIIGDYKRLVPRIVSDKDVKVSEQIDSFIAAAWLALNFSHYSARMKLLYGQNAADQGLISGYGVHTINPVTDERTYTPIACLAGWIDTSYVLKGYKSEIGLFIGGTKNLGSTKRLALDEQGKPIIYSFFPVIQNVGTIVQFSPRYVWTHDPLRIGIEVQITRASFGTPNRFARICHASPVTNVRVLCSVFYAF